MSKKEGSPARRDRAFNKLQLNIGVRDNKGIVSDYILNISLIYPKLILTLSSFYSLVLITNNYILKTINLFSLYPEDVRA